MYKIILGLMLMGLLSACQQVEELEMNTDSKQGLISHLVFFNLKDSISRKDMIDLPSIINSLSTIPGVLNFESGTFHDLDDPRAFSDYELVIQMEFKSKADYLNYQQHKIHMDAKKALGIYLAAAPRSYDYQIR